MDTITKAAQPYTPPSTAILHQTEASLTARPLPPPVHLVQYDQTMPILQVALYSHGQPYTVPAGAAVNVRMDKLDGHYVYNPALGLDNTRTIAYIAITQQMTTGAGCYRPIVEVVVSGGIAGTAPLALQIDPNPVPQDAIESTDEYQTVQDLLAQTQAAAKAAADSAEAASDSQQAAADSAEAASDSQQAAAGSATTAQQQANIATQQATAAEASATEAQGSATTAQQQATTATQQATAAADSAAAAEAAAQRAEEIAGGTANEAKKLETARAIDGVNFDGTADIMHYGTCGTSAGTAAKIVSVTGYKLVAGAWVMVKFANTNTAANPTLNVTGTGAKPIYYRGKAVAAGVLAEGRTYGFVYNGTQFELIGDLDTNTTYDNMTGATANAAGKAGLVPAPAAGGQGKYLRGDGTWETPPDTNTTYGNMTGATASAAGKAGLVPAPAKGAQAQYLRGDGTWATPPDTHANHWTITVPASGWTGSGPYTNTITVSGMTASTNLGVIKLAAASVGVAAAELAMSQWDTIDSQAGKVVLTAKGTKPAANFTIDVWEVK